MQILQVTDPYSLSSQDHYIEGFLIGTKQTQEQPQPWRISKQTAKQNVTKFVGKPFSIIPELIDHAKDPSFNGHFFGIDKEDTQRQYNDHAHGVIEKVLGPYSYNDGTTDFYFKHITKLTNQKAASIVKEYGQQTLIPYSTSPHIFVDDDSPDDNILDWSPVGIALVVKGAMGHLSVINRMCNGSGHACHRSLSASIKKCDCSSIDRIFTSHLQKTASVSAENILSENTQNQLATNDTTPAGNISQGPALSNIPTQVANPTVNPQQHLTTEKQNAEQITLSKAEYDTFLKEKTYTESLRAKVELLEKDRKTTVLGNIFGSITDENVKTTLTNKWLPSEHVDTLKDFYNDINTSVVPALVEKALAEYKQSQGQNQEVKKQKSASISQETKFPIPGQTDEGKTASVTSKTNEVSLLRKYLFGGF